MKMVMSGNCNTNFSRCLLVMQLNHCLFENMLRWDVRRRQFDVRLRRANATPNSHLASPDEKSVNGNWMSVNAIQTLAEMGCQSATIGCTSATIGCPPTPPQILVRQAPMRWALTANGWALTPYRLWRRLGLFSLKSFTSYPIFFPLPSDNCVGIKIRPEKLFYHVFVQHPRGTLNN